MSEKVQPEALIPVHTQHPEVFQNLHDNVILPKRGVKVVVLPNPSYTAEQSLMHRHTHRIARGLRCFFTSITPRFFILPKSGSIGNKSCDLDPLFEGVRPLLGDALEIELAKALSDIFRTERSYFRIRASSPATDENTQKELKQNREALARSQ